MFVGLHYTMSSMQRINIMYSKNVLSLPLDPFKERIFLSGLKSHIKIKNTIPYNPIIVICKCYYLIILTFMQRFFNVEMSQHNMTVNNNH